MGSEHDLSRGIPKQTLPRHVRADVVDEFSTLASSTGEDWKVDALDEEASRRKAENVVEAQHGLH